MTRTSSGRPPVSMPSRKSWSIAVRKAASVLPEPVGAAMSVSSPRRMARQPSSARRAKTRSRRSASAPARSRCRRSAKSSSSTVNAMNKQLGMLELDELAKLARQGEVETVIVGFTDHYGRLMGKRFDAEMFVQDIAEHGAHACDYLLTVDMEMDPVPGYKFANWELGYGDFHLVPDMKTL